MNWRLVNLASITRPVWPSARAGISRSRVALSSRPSSGLTWAKTFSNSARSFGFHLRQAVLLDIAIADADPLDQQVVAFGRDLAPADQHGDRVAADVLEQIQRFGGIQLGVLAPIVVIAFHAAGREKADRRRGAHLGNERLEVRGHLGRVLGDFLAKLVRDRQRGQQWS